MRAICIVYILSFNISKVLKCNGSGQYLGCVEKNFIRSELYVANEFIFNFDACIEECIYRNYFYALTEAKNVCFCSRLLNIVINGNVCVTPCQAIINQSCDNIFSLDIYNVTQRVPGKIAYINLSESSMNSFTIKWDQPIYTNGFLINYKVSILLNFAFDKNISKDKATGNIENIYNSNIMSAKFFDLYSASRYLLKIKASNKYGYGVNLLQYLWTKIDMPNEIPNFNILNTSNNTLVNFDAFLLTSGPISAYRVIICDTINGENDHKHLSVLDSQTFLTELEERNKLHNSKIESYFQYSNQTTWETNISIAYSPQRVPSYLNQCYITAQISFKLTFGRSELEPISFVIGDNKTYDGYWNKVTSKSITKENIFIGVVSDIGEYLMDTTDLYHQERKVLYSFQRYSVNDLHTFMNVPPTNSWNKIYPILINVMTALISLIIVLLSLYVGMHYLHHKRIRVSKHAYHNEFSSTNALTRDIHLSLITKQQGGSADQSLLEVMKLGDITDLCGLVQRLVPQSLLYGSQSFHFTPQRTLVGMGKFGRIYKGNLHIGAGESTEAAILTTQLRDFPAMEDGLMEIAKALKVAVAIRSHPNFLKFSGVAFGETSSDELWVALEPLKPPLLNLRDAVLRLELRQLSNDIAYGANYHRATFDLLIKNLMEIALGIASGLRRLEELNVFHPKLAAKNVWVEGYYPKGSATKTYFPKIGALGFHDYSGGALCHAAPYHEQRQIEQGPTTNTADRWQAPEYIFGRSFTFKSTIWSLGILLWEIFTLGGTPYGDHNTSEAAKKIRLANLRPNKPSLCATDNDELYQLLLDCWSLQPEERPNMASIISNLESFSLNPEIYFTSTPGELEIIDVEKDESN